MKMNENTRKGVNNSSFIHVQQYTKIHEDTRKGLKMTENTQDYTRELQLKIRNITKSHVTPFNSMNDDEMTLKLMKCGVSEENAQRGLYGMVKSNEISWNGMEYTRSHRNTYFALK